jgi:hypothetical protein
MYNQGNGDSLRANGRVDKNNRLSSARGKENGHRLCEEASKDR